MHRSHTGTLMWGAAGLLMHASGLAAVDGFPLYRIAYQFGDPQAIAYAFDMNARDQVVGEMFNFKGKPMSLGFRWTAHRGVEAVRDFRGGYEHSQLVAVSDNGTAVGYGTVKAAGDRFKHRALLVRPNGERVALPHPGTPEQHSAAVDVSDAGVAVGHVGDDPNWPQYSVRWLPDGSVERLDVPGKVMAINARGDMAGEMNSGMAYFISASGERHDIPMSSVLSLNEDGVVAGTAQQGGVRPVVWSVEQGLQVLPTPRQMPQASCYAYAVNRHGQVVGACAPEVGNSVAMTWLRIDGIWQSANLTWQLQDGSLDPDADSWAFRITDAGHVLVDSARGKASLRPMILVPVKH